MLGSLPITDLAYERVDDIPIEIVFISIGARQYELQSILNTFYWPAYSVLTL